MYRSTWCPDENRSRSQSATGRLCYGAVSCKRTWSTRTRVTGPISGVCCQQPHSEALNKLLRLRAADQVQPRQRYCTCNESLNDGIVSGCKVIAVRSASDPLGLHEGPRLVSCWTFLHFRIAFFCLAYAVVCDEFPPSFVRYEFAVELRIPTRTVLYSTCTTNVAAGCDLLLVRK